MEEKSNIIQLHPDNRISADSQKDGSSTDASSAELIKELTQRCKYLEQIIEINKISTLDVLIEDYLLSSKEFYKKITYELLVCEHEEKTRDKVKTLIDYFNHLSKEFEKFL